MSWVCFLIYVEPEALSYEIFMWGDVGMSTDVRFYGVAPHWYFRPYMAWLIICPFHRVGIFGLVFFFFVLYFQVNIMSGLEVGTHKDVHYLGGTFSSVFGRARIHTMWTKIFVENSIYFLV